jgi:hypothetical protein
MKKIAVFLAAIFVSISLLAQNTLEIVKNLNEARKTELEMIATRAESLSPTKQAKFIKKESRLVNKRYDELIAQAIKQGEGQKEQGHSRRIAGANMKIQNGQGSFSAKSPNIIRGANAYATANIADANATLIRSLSQNGNVVSANSIRSTGLEGIVANRNRYGEMKIIIEGVSAGNKFKKTYLLSPNQEISDYLLPGRYKAIIQENGKTPLTEEFDVLGGQNMNHNYDGQTVFWAVWGGSRNY